MAVARKISAAVFEKLSDALKAEYKKDGENYVLDIEGDDDAGELRRAHDRVKEENRTLKEERNRFRDENEELKSSDAGRRNADIRTLEKSWKDKLAEKETTHKAELTKRDSFIEKTLRENVASELASAISKAPKLLTPHILPRLKVEWDGETPVTRILDKDGKISALTREDLQKEVASNPDFAPIITASRATGSGGAGKPPVTRNGDATQEKPVSLAAMNPRDLAGLIAERVAAKSST